MNKVGCVPPGSPVKDTGKTVFLAKGGVLELDTAGVVNRKAFTHAFNVTAQAGARCWQVINGRGEVVAEENRFAREMPGVPADWWWLRYVPTIGPRRFRQLRDHYVTVAEVVAAARAGKLIKLPSFGRRSQAQILTASETWKL